MLFTAPNAPMIEVYSNQSNAVIVKWSSPVIFTKQIDRYIIKCETVSNGSIGDHMKEIRMDRVDPKADWHEVNVSHIVGKYIPQS